MTRTTQIALVLFALLGTGLTAQEQGSSAGSIGDLRPGLDVHAGDGL